MGSLFVNQNLITPKNAEEIKAVCPFGAITYENGKIEISSACKMCKLCVKKGNGLIEFKEDEIKEIDKSLWRGICVYVDHNGNNISRVTYELCGKAKELAAVTNHPVHALLIGKDMGNTAQKLLRYGVDNVFLNNN